MAGETMWPTLTAAAHQLGLTPEQMTAFADVADLEVSRRGKRWRINPEQLSEDMRAQAEAWLVSRETQPQDTVESSSAAQLRAATEALRASAVHAERLLSMVTEPAERLLRQHQSLNEVLLAQVREMHAQHAALVQAREEALNQAAERQAVAASAEADIRMRQQALDLVGDNLPTLLGGIALAQKPETKAALKLLSSLDDAMLQGLVEEGVDLLDSKQKSLVREILSARANNNGAPKSQAQESSP